VYFIYLSGNTFNLKDEIKSLIPNRKDFVNWWKFKPDIKCWELNVPNSIFSKKFRNDLEEFANKHNIKLEISEFTKQTKSINDFNSPEDFFAYLHKNNSYR
jgi:hypothetical protein